MLDPKTLQPGQEQYEKYKAVTNKNYYQYDYRAENGNLFSVIAPTLEAARKKKEEWINQNA